MQAQYDVIVVGAGPGGAVCAATLAARGAKVLLLDEKRPGWHKPCGGLPEALLARYDVPAALGFATPRIRVVDRHAREAVAPLRYRDVYRNVFDEHLAGQARRAGDNVVLDAAVTELWRAGAGFVVRTTRGTSRASYLVGADGCSSVVRRQLFSEPLRDEMCAIAVEHWYRVRHGLASLDFHVDPALLATVFAGIPVALQSGRLAGRAIARGSDEPLTRYTPAALRAASPGLAICHAYYDLLLAEGRPPAFMTLARPHLLPRLYSIWQMLGRLVDGLDVARQIAATRPDAVTPGLNADEASHG